MTKRLLELAQPDSDLLAALPPDVVTAILRILTPTIRHTTDRLRYAALARLASCCSALRHRLAPILPAVHEAFVRRFCFLCRNEPARWTLGCRGESGCVLERDDEDESSEEDSFCERQICLTCTEGHCGACGRGYCGCVPLVDDCDVCGYRVCARCTEDPDRFDYEQHCCYTCRIHSNDVQSDDDDA